MLDGERQHETLVRQHPAIGSRPPAGCGVGSRGGRSGRARIAFVTAAGRFLRLRVDGDMVADLVQLLPAASRRVEARKGEGHHPPDEPGRLRSRRMWARSDAPGTTRLPF